jgi:Putative metallopeptidase
MRSRLFRRQHILLPPLFAVMLISGPLFAQPAPAQPGTLQARSDAAAVALEKNPRFKNLSPLYRQQIAEFMAGNTLFVLLHEMAHAATSQMRIPALDRKEDAADSFAVTQLIKLGSGFPDRVLQESAKGWFLSDQRGQENGDPIQYYDEHGIDQQRAHQIVCLLLGTGEDKYKRLAAVTKLPKDRQDSCAGDLSAASDAWDMALKPHLRSPDQPKTKIDVVYGDAKGKLEAAAQALRSMRLLETVAERMADTYAWPAPFALEMQSCGYPNAQWLAAAHKLVLCYELASDFGDLYRGYGERPSNSETRKPRAR